LLDWFSMLAKTNGTDVLTLIKVAMNDIVLKVNKLYGMTTDSASSMIRRVKRVVSLLEKES